MNELIKSCDYARLADLIEQGVHLPVGKILDGCEFWFGCAEYFAPEYDDGYHKYRALDGEDFRGADAANQDKATARAAFIKDCEEIKLFFVDPASQHYTQERTSAEIVSPGLELVAAERRRQITEEGHTVETDLAHNSTEALIGAAVAYLMASVKRPAAADWWLVGWGPMKSTTPERDLVKGLALGIAAIDRIKAEEAMKGAEPHTRR